MRHHILRQHHSLSLRGNYCDLTQIERKSLMNSKKCLFLLPVLVVAVVLSVAIAHNMPGAMSFFESGSVRGAETCCTEVNSKTTMDSQSDCPSDEGCQGTRIPGYRADKVTGDTLDIVMTYTKCQGTPNCLINKFKDWEKSSECTENVYQ